VWIARISHTSIPQWECNVTFRAPSFHPTALPFPLTSSTPNRLIDLTSRRWISARSVPCASFPCLQFILFAIRPLVDCNVYLQHALMHEFMHACAT
jgi:hypothetical protein